MPGLLRKRGFSLINTDCGSTLVSNENPLSLDDRKVSFGEASSLLSIDAMLYLREYGLCDFGDSIPT
jgi:hypothetical protein